MIDAAANALPAYDIALCRYDELSAKDVDAWRALCGQSPDYDSALLTPEFACIVASVRTDVRMITVREDEALKAILPVHLRPDGLARPIGTPFADYSGPVVSRGLNVDLAGLLNAAGVAAFSSPAVPDPWSALPGRHCRRGDDASHSHVIRQPADRTASLLEVQRKANPKRFKNFRRLRNQLERDVGELRFEWGKPDPATLDALLSFKQRQFRETGFVDLTTATRSRELLDAVARSPYAFMTLVQTDTGLVSGHFGVRVGRSFHPWIAAFNPAFAHFSPGNLLLVAVLENLTSMGLTTYDLADGHDHYKKYFANDVRKAWPVFETASGLAGFRHRLNRSLWHLAGADADGSIAGRLSRRIDQIAVSEFSAVSRLREFAYAVRARSIRSDGN